MPPEPSTRTQLYLTDAQRRRLDAFCRTRGIAMAEAVREAVDAYLDREYVSCADALDRTWGRAPKAEIPSRDEWDAPRGGGGGGAGRGSRPAPTSGVKQPARPKQLRAPRAADGRQRPPSPAPARTRRSAGSKP